VPEYVTVIINAIEQYFHWFVEAGLLNKFIWTIVSCSLVYVVAKAARHMLTSEDQDIQTRHKFRGAIYWARNLTWVVCLLLIWGARIENVGMFLGILGAGIALSMQEILLSLVGWLVILVRRPFDIGDRVEVDGRIGDVIDIGLFHSTMLEVGNWVHADQSTGRIVVVPNSAFVRHLTFNYTKGFPFVWNEIKLVVTYESNWRRAKELLLKRSQIEAEKIANEVQRQINKMQERYAIIRYRQLTPFVYTTVVDNGVALTLRYLTPVRSRRGSAHQIYEGILEDFVQEHEIDFAYPTTRFYDNVVEGKPGARAAAK